jgi:hypothetical protein
MRPRKSPGTCATPQAKVLELGGGDEDGDAVREPDHHRPGMNLTRELMQKRPMSTGKTPAIIVHMNRPSMPYRATIPATTTTNAPVGPPIWVRGPQGRDQEASDDRAVDAGLRGGPERWRRPWPGATRPTVTPASRSAESVREVVAARSVRTDFGNQTRVKAAAT